MVNIQFTIFPLHLNCSVSFEGEERKAIVVKKLDVSKK